MERVAELMTPSAAVPPNEMAASKTKATRVMVVEDEAVVALHLRQELTKLGHVVAGVASNGEQALKMI
jgi:PleD family two-component response regulator